MYVDYVRVVYIYFINVCVVEFLLYAVLTFSRMPPRPLFVSTVLTRDVRIQNTYVDYVRIRVYVECRIVIVNIV